MKEARTLTVRGSSPEDATVQAALTIDSRPGWTITGIPTRTRTFVPAYGTDEKGRPRVWLWKVPVEVEQ